MNAQELAEHLNRDEPFAVKFRYNTQDQITLELDQAQALLSWIHRHFPPADSRGIAVQCIEDTRSESHNKIAAIKLYRTRTNASLGDALDAINRVWPHA